MLTIYIYANSKTVSIVRKALTVQFKYNFLLLEIIKNQIHINNIIINGEI